MVSQEIDVPPAWERLRLERLRGTLLIVGASDVGKSTFARYAYQRLCAAGIRTAYLDGDPGQSTLGPPAAMMVALGEPGSADFPPRGPVWRWFVGAVSPQAHMLPVVVGGARLAQAAYRAGAEVILYDSSGLISPALKWAEIDLLQPAAVMGIQRRDELQPLLLPWRRSRRVRVIDLPCSSLARRRDVPARQAHRAKQFEQYMRHAQPLDVDWSRRAVLPAPRFALHQWVALEDAAGLMLGAGIVLERDAAQRAGGHDGPPGHEGAPGERIPAPVVTLLTPLPGLEGVDALHVGDLLVDPETFRDRPAGG